MDVEELRHDRRDIVSIKAITRDLVADATALPVGDGRYLTLVPVSHLMQLRDFFGDDGLADCWAVVDGPHLRSLRRSAGMPTPPEQLLVHRPPTKPKSIRVEPARSLPAPIPRVPNAPKPDKRRREPAMTADEFTAAAGTLGLTVADLAKAAGYGAVAAEFWAEGSYAPPTKAAKAIRALVAAKGGA